MPLEFLTEMRTHPVDDLSQWPATPRRRPRLLWIGLVTCALLACAGMQAQRKWARATAPRQPLNMAAVRALLPEATDQCDVLVSGGTPSGVAAALAAARRGASVMLVESRPHLGGDITYALVNMFDVPTEHGRPAPFSGIFADFYKNLGIACDTKRAYKLLEASVARDHNIRTVLGTRVVRIIRNGDRVVGVTLRGTPAKGAPPSERTVAVGTVVDASTDAYFAARAGATYYLGREAGGRDTRMQAAGLLFAVGGVDWKAICTYAQSLRPVLLRDCRHDRLPADAVGKLPPRARLHPVPTTPYGPDSVVPQAWVRLGGVNGNYVFERGDIIKHYEPHGSNIVVLSVNFGRQNDGTVILNTLNVVNVNALDAQSLRQGRSEAVAELPYLLDYLRHTMPGFTNARLARVAPEMYIRETRHIHGFYTLSANDIVAQRRFDDRIARASYPIDLHPYAQGDINPFAPRHYDYTLPLRSLVPTSVDGVFVASRSLAATYTAAGSARVVPVTMAAGEAAGAAAWLCTQLNITPHTLVNDPEAIAILQDSLREGGADIGDTPPDAPSDAPQPKIEPAQPKIEPAQVAATLRKR